MAHIDFGGFDALTFDVYGTLIDWEAGLLNALQPVLAPRGVELSEDELLERYAGHEARLEAGRYMRYREVLGSALRALCEEIGFTPTHEEIGEFAASVGHWPAFADSAAALRRLSARFKLAVITNCDDDLFAISSRRLGVSFDWIVTAQAARSYKPSPNNFEVALHTIDIARERILHVAQSLFHDHVPARELGIPTAWIDRRHDKEGFGATPTASAMPALTTPDMETFADVALV